MIVGTPAGQDSRTAVPIVEDVTECGTVYRDRFGRLMILSRLGSEIHSVANGKGVIQLQGMKLNFQVFFFAFECADDVPHR
jgi:short subunit dehydrogenase-like uncharacterized protein